MAGLYPSIEPYEHGMLDVGDVQRLYWESCGDPEGKPAVVLHGGPGSGCSPGARRYFDPDRYRIVLFDQRGCGRSTPHASDPATDLSTNTTAHLLADIERLRQHLGIERWLVLGGSWGSTLALAYAERHPERVSEMVLSGVATTTRQEIDWVTRGVGILLPEAWDRFREGVPAADRDGDLADAYHRLLASPDLAVRDKAALDWCDWEMALVAVHPDHRPLPRCPAGSGRTSGSHSRASSPTIGVTLRGSGTTSCSGVPTASPASPASWCTAGSTSRARSSRRGGWLRSGAAASW